jgi:hypothetical protein
MGHRLLAWSAWPLCVLTYISVMVTVASLNPNLLGPALGIGSRVIRSRSRKKPRPSSTAIEYNEASHSQGRSPATGDASHEKAPAGKLPGHGSMGLQSPGECSIGNPCE